MQAKYADNEHNEIILMSILRTAVVGTNDKIAYVINAALELLTNTL